MITYFELKEWVYQWWVGLDQWVNTWFRGAADETMSSRLYRLNHIKGYRYLQLFVDLLFLPAQGPDHCMHAYMKEILGRQLPNKFYDRAIAMNLEMDRQKLGPNIELPQ